MVVIWILVFFNNGFVIYLVWNILVIILVCVSIVFFVMFVVLFVYCKKVRLLFFKFGFIYWCCLLIFKVLWKFIVCGNLYFGMSFLMYFIIKFISVCFLNESWLFIWVKIICFIWVLKIIFLSVVVKLEMMIIVFVLLLLSWCFNLCGV